MTYDQLILIDEQGRDFDAKATATISGGFLVGWSSGTDCVGSTLDTYASPSEICVEPCDTTTNCMGIAANTVTSGQIVKIFTRGKFILPAGSTAVTGGVRVSPAGYENMVIPASDLVKSGASIGRALTAATALTGFAVVMLDV